jgi:transcription elongation GreA/GreB family factor
MNKVYLLQLIISKLSDDLKVLLNAAKTAHEASTHEENIPDNKYETLALEASYVAQGQANRAQEIRLALETYKQLSLQNFCRDAAIRLTALVTLEGQDGSSKTVFIGPQEGGLKITNGQANIMVITPQSPLGRDLIGKSVGDQLKIGIGAGRKEFEIVDVS